MSDLNALVYVSSAVGELSHGEIDHLLTRARERNLECSITGLLLFIGGNFMQYLEGLSDELELIYKIIKEDPMHKNLIKIMHRPIESRDFSHWSMAYCTKGSAVAVGDYNDQAILNGKLGRASYKETPARTLLHDFWRTNTA